MFDGGQHMFPQLVPQPVRVQPLAGEFILSPGAVIAAQDEALPAARLLAEWLSRSTGYGLPLQPWLSPGLPGIRLEIDLSLAALGREGYRLEVNNSGVLLRAPAPAGLLHASQTLRQLFPPEIFSEGALNGISWTLPCAEIEDQPRFAWRGGMLDVSRHFMPLEFIERFIDLLALHKMNFFHWHLTDDQGWRIEIKRYPRLTEVGAWRPETIVGRMRRDQTEFQYDGVPHGGFYTQDEIRRVVEFASRRGVRVVPEIEVPGHSQAAIAAYPKLGCGPEPLEVARQWSIFTYDVYNPFEPTFEFLENVFGEVTDLFPGLFIHVGGDEVLKKSWQENQAVQQRMKDLELADEDALQSYFIRRLETILQGHGRRLVGWDEILEGGLASSATVMSWRGEVGGIAAAQAGHDVVMAPNTYTYFDYYQATDKEAEPLAIGGFVPLSKVYSYNPIPAELTPEQARHVLGTQFQVWTEYMGGPAQVEYMAYPRACALSEAAWSPLEGKDWQAFTARLSAHLKRLDMMKVNYRKAEWE
jgi:hexosaminidase